MKSVTKDGPMNSTAVAAAFALNSQAQVQQAMATSIVRSAHAADMAMVNMLDQSLEMAKAAQGPPPAGMGANVDKMA